MRRRRTAGGTTPGAVASTRRDAAAVLGVMGVLGGAALAQADARRSGLDFMSPALQTLQRDDQQNPAMLAVQDGEALWRTPAGAARQACADCHGAAPASGWAAR